MNFHQLIKNYLVDELGLDENIEDNQSLFIDGVLDSMDVVGLLSFIEKEFHIKFNPFDVGIEEFDSIALIVQTVQKNIG